MSALTAPLPSVTTHLGSQEFLDLVRAAVHGSLAKLDVGANVLFAGCGPAKTLVEAARIFPRSRFLGTEPVTGELETARQTVRAAGLQNPLIGQPAIIRQPHLQGIFDFIIRQGGEASAPMDSLPGLLRGGGLLFDLGNELPSPADYHDTGLVILRTLRLADGTACIVAGNWASPNPFRRV